MSPYGRGNRGGRIPGRLPPPPVGGGYPMMGPSGGGDVRDMAHFAMHPAPMPGFMPGYPMPMGMMERPPPPGTPGISSGLQVRPEYQPCANLSLDFQPILNPCMLRLLCRSPEFIRGRDICNCNLCCNISTGFLLVFCQQLKFRSHSKARSAPLHQLGKHSSTSLSVPPTHLLS